MFFYGLYVCWVLVSEVHPVAILSAVFCVFCSLLMFVSGASGDHIVCCEYRFLVFPHVEYMLL